MANYGMACSGGGGFAPPAIGPQGWNPRAAIDAAVQLLNGYLSQNKRYEDPIGALSAQTAGVPFRFPPNGVAQEAYERMIAQPPPPPPSSNPVTALQTNQPAKDPFTGNIAIIQPRQSPEPARLQRAEPTGSYAACAGTSTFGGYSPAYCEMGGYVYLQNGTVLKAH
jgi:hypothetical protein